MYSRAMAISADQSTVFHRFRAVCEASPNRTGTFAVNCRAWGSIKSLSFSALFYSSYGPDTCPGCTIVTIVHYNTVIGQYLSRHFKKWPMYTPEASPTAHTTAQPEGALNY
ncbi:hypothetical protein OUZ56_019744 [Daphnia magna]|uniref:Uncharacterized protein n=1 Tax=Daphnia magna TaxID=35525 RepID=A0ABQ9ZCH4_9CRUS|nr:hypothetical protein OUZ56_019744 [Daphnia magna]